MVFKYLVGRIASSLVLLAASAAVSTGTAAAQTAPASIPSDCKSLDFSQFGSGPGGSIIGIKGVAPSSDRMLVANISDTGFDAPCYVLTTWVSPDPNSGRIRFVNTGTRIHDVQSMPGYTAKGAQVTERITGLGKDTPFGFYDKRSRMGSLNTGGIDPGGSVTMAFQSNYANAAPGTPNYVLTSGTDCLFGNQTPGFNCNGVPLYIKSAIGDDMAVGVDGSTLDYPDPGNTNCAWTVIDSTGTICWTKVRKWSTLLGSFRKPVGDFTVTIDDVKGYQPNFIIAKAGSTMTLINNGKRVHGAYTSFGPRYRFQQLDAGGLGPGQSYQFTFACNPPTATQRCGTYFQTFTSYAVTDLALPFQNGQPGNVNGCVSNFRGGTCGVSAFAATVTIVP